MIKYCRRWLLRLAGQGVRYARWERRITRRLSGWTVRRRWLTFVLLPAFMFCCGGTVVGVPVAWVLRQTVDAGRGAESPDAAASSYLMALGRGAEEGLLPLLDDARQAELLAGWRNYRQAMTSTTPAPSRLDFASLVVGPLANGRAEVTTEVSATWWGVGGQERGYSSTDRVWRFDTREDGGWRVTAVDAPEWCGGYVRLDACA